MTSKKTVVLVAGPESSGTRIFTEVLSQHPDVAGSPTASDHFDLLDEIWTEIRIGSESAAVQKLISCTQADTIITRRSLPHGPDVGAPAEYMTFPDFEAFLNVVTECGYRLVVFVATRSPLSTVVSCTLQRDSVSRDLQKAFNQYQASLRHVTGFCVRHDIPFFVLSLEAAVLDGKAYINSLFNIVGLPSQSDLSFHGRSDVNYRRYQWADSNLEQRLLANDVSALEARGSDEKPTAIRKTSIGALWQRLAG